MMWIPTSLPVFEPLYLLVCELGLSGADYTMDDRLGSLPISVCSLCVCSGRNETLEGPQIYIKTGPSTSSPERCNSHWKTNRSSSISFFRTAILSHSQVRSVSEKKPSANQT